MAAIAGSCGLVVRKCLPDLKAVRSSRHLPHGQQGARVPRRSFCILVEGESSRRQSSHRRHAVRLAPHPFFSSSPCRWKASESQFLSLSKFSYCRTRGAKGYDFKRRHELVKAAGRCGMQSSSPSEGDGDVSYKERSSESDELSSTAGGASSLSPVCEVASHENGETALPSTSAPAASSPVSESWLELWRLKMSKMMPLVSRHATDLLLGTWRFLQRPAVMVILAAFLMMQLPNAALAAKSGGRVGGRAFSSPSRSSGPSRVYSAPSRGGGGPGMFSAPYFAPSPFFGGGWGWNPFYAAPTVVVGGGGGGGGLITLLMFGVVAAFLFQTVSGFLSDNSDEGSSSILGGERIGVLKLQVGLLGLARSLQTDLDRIADRADTSSPRGLHYVLTETVLALLRHPDYCVYGTSLSETKRGVEKAEERFNQLSLEERSKIKEETLVNVDSRVRRASSSGGGGGGGDRFSNEYIVVTILVATDGAINDFPSRLNNLSDLREALTRLGAIPADQVQAVEILWTPQDLGDTLTEREMLRDYPQLRNL